MSLEPCKVCGTLNSDQAEICLSCGHSTQGHKRPTLFRWAAIALAICFALPFLTGLINWILQQLKPESPTPSQPQVSLEQSFERRQTAQGSIFTLVLSKAKPDKSLTKN